MNNDDQTYDWMPEARQIAAQCWCDPETARIAMDAVLAEAVAKRIAVWMQTGAQHARNETYWRERARGREQEEAMTAKIMMYSWRTIMSGEVVAFATGFERVRDDYHRAVGPFDVSASRDAVMVHRAECRTPEETAALIAAIQHAEAARIALNRARHSGGRSLYPSVPTPVGQDKP